MSEVKFYIYEDKERNSKNVKAVSVFKGKTYSGIAKCDLSKDTFDEEIGKRLAEARLKVKIANAKGKILYKEYRDKEKEMMKAMRKFDKAKKAFVEHTKVLSETIVVVNEIESYVREEE